MTLGAKDGAKAGGGLDRRDIAGLAGIVLIGIGAGMIFLPLGLIIPGAILTGVAVFGVR